MPPAAQRGFTRASASPASSLPNLSSPSASEDPISPTSSVSTIPASSHAAAAVAATADAPPSSSAPSALRSRFLSRLGLPTLPWANRNRNVVDFHIRCDEPHKNYTAGDPVRGAVLLTVVKPLRITHLVVCLHGYVRVDKVKLANPKPQDSAALLGQGDSDGAEYLGRGLATLFRDEQPLSGEGRLDPGKYEFNFNLLFPSGDLPSSIDFERGSISYLVTATLTRPTTISPVISCDRNVVLVDNIDVGLLPPPRPRTIFLEPISKRTRRKKSTNLDKASSTTVDTNGLASEVESVAPSVATDEYGRNGTPAEHRAGTQSDRRSEMSEESGRSISTAISRTEFKYSSPAKQQAVDDKTITASIQLLKGGCLAGDVVTIRVSVQHVKRLKSMTGVVATLFRQSKIDFSPAPDMFDGPNSKDDGRGGNEAYPRSKTGLAGLSLSSTSSLSMFRKDLDQATVPLIIDPTTLQASVIVSLRIPDDSFPTIRNVPGEMISFTYQIEVIVDLGGRLSNHMQGGGSSRFTSYGTGNAEQNPSHFNSLKGTHIADTTHLRREKGVISVSMETVVGTMDSSRNRTSAKAMSTPHTYVVAGTGDEEMIRPEIAQQDDLHHGFGPSSTNSVFPPSIASSRGDGHYQPGLSSHTQYHGQPSPSAPSRLSYPDTNGESAPAYFPPPQLPDQNAMTEKERIRQAETRLLPSQPPGAEAASSSTSAPTVPTDDDIYEAQDTPRPSCPDIRTAAANGNFSEAGPSAPTQEEISTSSAPEQPTEDKQELERRRLQHEASAPPDFPDDMEQQHSIGEAGADVEPTAPTLDEEDRYAGYSGGAAGPSGTNGSGSDDPDHGHRHHNQDHPEQLPAYER